MKIIKIYANQPFLCEESSVACIGYFDGLHLGHQHLFDKVFFYANKYNVKKACICFDEDPWIVMHKSEDVSHLTPLNKRLSLLERFGFDICYLLHFDIAMMNLEADTFIQNILNKMQLKCLVCGDDFHFAHKGKGNINTLKNGNFEVCNVHHLCYEDNKISSSIIEKYILNGDVAIANKLLGYTYNIEGIVVDGNKVGQNKLGFPTANIMLKEDYIIPKEGVYAGFVSADHKIYKAMINIGFNPTMNQVNNLSIEAHIIDFNKQIYGNSIIVYFDRFLREERKFEDTEALIKQLNLDLCSVRGGNHALRVI